MTLQTSGAISLNNVNVELGRSGTASINMNETAVRTLAGKASGAISMSDFYGKSNETITLSGVAISSTGGGSQTATYTLESDGDIVRFTTPLGSGDIGDWISPKSAAPSNYEVRATLNSGSLTSGTTDSWLALTSNRSWSLTRVVVGAADQVDLTIEIRKGSGAVLATATVTLDAERF
jgi:hypothetical protein